MKNDGMPWEVGGEFEGRYWHKNTIFIGMYDLFQELNNFLKAKDATCDISTFNFFGYIVVYVSILFFLKYKIIIKWKTFFANSTWVMVGKIITSFVKIGFNNMEGLCSTMHNHLQKLSKRCEILRWRVVHYLLVLREFNICYLRMKHMHLLKNAQTWNIYWNVLLKF